MGLVEQAREDWREITSNNNEFGVTMTFVAPNLFEAEVKGLHTKHHLQVGTNGVAFNGKNAHVSVSEKVLLDKNYPTRNADGNVDFRRHKVKVKDSTGIEKTYEIREWFPDETVGVLIFILNDFKTV